MTAKHRPLVARPPDAALRACVVIPVAGDAPHLKRALEALATQTGARSRPLAPHLFEVVLLFGNSCPLDIAPQVQHNQPWLRLHVIRSECLVTPAELRSAVINEACCRLHRAGNPRGLILITGSDAVVAPDWIATNMAEIEAGADAVAGRILLRPEAVENGDTLARDLYRLDDQYRLLQAVLEDYYDPLAHDPMPRHHQHSYASFAVTAEAYAESGGLSPGSNAALYDALLYHDIRVRHSPVVRVFTSSFSRDSNAGVLLQLGGCRLRPGEGERLPVESIEFLEAFFSARRRARCLWKSSRTSMLIAAPAVAELTDLVGIQRHLMREFLAESPSFGQFLAWLQLRKRLEMRWRNRGRFEPLARALEKLQQRFETFPAERRKINLGVRSITVLSRL